LNFQKWARNHWSTHLFLEELWFLLTILSSVGISIP
jgi:hypothetical protein